MLPQTNVMPTTPMGGTLVPGGATFRLWAPRATAVYLMGAFNAWTIDPAWQLSRGPAGHWTGFAAGLKEGDQYKFWIVGPGDAGYKRDPRGRELTFKPAFPSANNVLRNPASFPWKTNSFGRPAFSDLVIYQLHVGTYAIRPGKFNGKFFDVLDKIPYLQALGVNAIEPLPVDEFPTEFSLGYNGTDYYSVETDYAEPDSEELATYTARANQLLADHGLPPYTIDDLRPPSHQLKALVDVAHAYGLSVILDVVYNHAGGGFDDESLWFLDRLPKGNNNDSLYFTDQGWAGGLVFAYWNQDVRQHLIDNAAYYYQEYRVDGFRFDEVSVMDRFGGWSTCQDMTDTLRYLQPSAPLIAEYWPVNPYVVRPRPQGGAGFDATWHDGLRSAVRGVLSQVAAGANAAINLDPVASNLYPSAMPDAWRGVTCLENHDIVKVGEQPRIARLADSSNSRSWYARSRSRVAHGLLLTAPGIPLLFMGEEFLEDKPWSDNPNAPNRIYWDGLAAGDKAMVDFLQFMRDLLRLRREQPAMRVGRLNVFHVHNDNRVLCLQRWIEGEGRDVVAAFSLREQTWNGYRVGFPGAGFWREVFNSDVYDNWVNPLVAGNGTGVMASGQTWQGMPTSAEIVIPANGFVVFAR